MGIEPTSETIVTPSTLCANGVNVQTRLHKSSGLVYRKNFGEGTSNDSFECDGLDICAWGEDQENVDIFDVEDCDCSDFFSGSYRVRDSSGQVKRAFERAPRTWCEESSTASSAGDGPPRAAGDVVLIDNMSLKIKSKCTPLTVRFWLEVCGWDYFPADSQVIKDFIEYEINETVDEKTTKLITRRCSTGRSDKRLGCYDIGAKTELDISLIAGYQYLAQVENTFKSNIGELKIVADIWENTSRASLIEGDC